ncbi:MAG: hypothetical protein OXE84_11555 [Rhodobacteraceae bacterium]|nr:hypothetical protein [Paracoccaceae bacterium]MCY4197180.1 hypothetical protein [Paracoccaceae bacterium]MCY4328013.1 hypothetical protein [Paracoccaceae bacterium]
MEKTIQPTGDLPTFAEFLELLGVVKNSAKDGGNHFPFQVFYFPIEIKIAM